MLTLRGANLQGAFLVGAEFTTETNLEDVCWGKKYILGDERPGHSAVDIYRRLRQWHTNAGIYNIAGEFYYREMEARRKTSKWDLNRLWLGIFSFLCGYGERPRRVIRWAALVILVSTLIYFLIGSVWEWSALWWSLYFSAVSFTALGYGSWLHVSNDLIKGIGAFESFIGVFTMALFLITFIRKMTR